VIGGTQDAATPPEHTQLIAGTIPDARLVELDAAHLSNVEQAEAFTHIIGHAIDWMRAC
jgi:3-oxoadipate enol-lactonase